MLSETSVMLRDGVSFETLSLEAGAQGVSPFEVLEWAMEDGVIEELSTRDQIFYKDELREYCDWYAKDYMEGSETDMVLNVYTAPSTEAVGTARNKVARLTLEDWCECEA